LPRSRHAVSKGRRSALLFPPRAGRPQPGPFPPTSRTTVVPHDCQALSSAYTPTLPSSCSRERWDDSRAAHLPGAPRTAARYRVVDTAIRCPSCAWLSVFSDRPQDFRAGVGALNQTCRCRGPYGVSTRTSPPTSKLAGSGNPTSRPLTPCGRLDSSRLRCRPFRVNTRSDCGPLRPGPSIPVSIKPRIH
jgi:hypothetical protein